MADSPFNCPKCKFVGKSAQSLKVHASRMHKAGKKGPAKKKTAVKKAGEGPKPRGRRCPKCGKIIKTAAALKAHMTRMHKRGRPKGDKKAVGASQLERDLMGVSLAGLVDLYEACQRELQRRLAEMVG